ncbi:YraN family protein [Patescibacteria group bacterium]|nr:YraN family protein [Patescibacteria group bacterium]
MDITHKSRKEVGALGEAVAAEYLRRHGMEVVDKNVARKTGELDVIALDPAGEVGETLHFVEVKTVVADEFPSDATRSAPGRPLDDYDPSLNLHEAKVRKVARTAEWYVAEKGWEG